MSGRDNDIGEFYVEELEELEIDNTPAPAPTADDRRRIAAQLAARAKAEQGRQVQRPKSAMELIQEAIAAEEAEKQRSIDEKRRLAAEARARAEAAQQRAAEQADAARRRAEEEARDAAEAARRAEEDRAAFAAMAGGTRREARPQRDLVPKGAAHAGRPDRTDPLGQMAIEARVAEMLAAIGDGVEVVDLYVTVPAAVVGPLWQAHFVRAQHEGDLSTAWMVNRVRDVVLGRPTDVVAARVRYGAKDWAAWIDLDDDVVLALLGPAEIYLVGLA